MDLAVNLNINGATFPDVESHLSTIKILMLLAAQTSPAPEDLGDAEDPYFIHLEDSEERRSLCFVFIVTQKHGKKIKAGFKNGGCWTCKAVFLFLGSGFIQTLFWGDCACFVRQRD